MSSFSLNRRHKAGLFLVLVASGLSLLFEASVKQTAGIVLLGTAATWLFGSMSLRTLGFASSSLVSIIGLYVAISPILDARYAYLAESESYDFALAEIRTAVASAPRPALGAQQLSQRDIQDLQQIRARLPAGDPRIGKIDALLQERINLPPGFVLEEPLLMPVQIPEAAQKWVRPDSIVALWYRATSKNIPIPFPGDASEDAIMAEFQAKYLLPRPTFSVATSIMANREIVISGSLLCALGLLGFAGMLWRERKTKPK